MSVRSRQLSVILMTFCLVLGACGGDGDDDATDPQPTTTSPSTTQSPEEEDEQALRQLAEDWYEFVGDVYRSTRRADGAERYITDPYLAQFEESVAEYVSDGNTSEESSESRHEVRSIEVEGDEATLNECIVDGDVLRAASGEVLNDTVLAQLVRTSATRTGEGWRLSDRQLISEQEGETECAA